MWSMVATVNAAGVIDTARVKRKKGKKNLQASVDMVGQAVGDALLGLHADVV